MPKSPLLHKSHVAGKLFWSLEHHRDISREQHIETVKFSRFIRPAGGYWSIEYV